MTTLVIDNALTDPAGTRERALAHLFKEEMGPDGATYKHISLKDQPVSEVTQVLEKYFNHVEWKLTFWRQDWDGEMPHAHCHADEICARYAVLWYGMPEPLCSGGTAFWRHAGTGLDYLPTDTDLSAGGIKPHLFHPWMTEQTKDAKNWALTGVVAMAANRLLVYPTKQWHSRFPANGFGDTQENGRMIWVGFFNGTPK